MSRDSLLRQIEVYAEELVSDLPTVEFRSPGLVEPKQKRRRGWLIGVATAAVLLVSGLIPLFLSPGTDLIPVDQSQETITPPTTTGPLEERVDGPAEEAGWSWIELDDRIYVSSGETALLGRLQNGSLVAIIDGDDPNRPGPKTVGETIEPQFPTDADDIVVNRSSVAEGCDPCELLIGDRAGNWRRQPLQDLDAVELQAMKVMEGLLWAQGSGKTWVSDDGASWDEIRFGGSQDGFDSFPLPGFEPVDLLRRGDRVVIVNGVNDAVIVSEDRGRSFEQSTDFQPRSSSQRGDQRPVELVWDRPDGFYILAGSQVWRSEDGYTWQSTGESNASSWLEEGITSFAISRPSPDSVLVTNGGNLVAGLAPDELHTSRDNGLTWRRSEFPFGFAEASIADDWIRLFTPSSDMDSHLLVVSNDGEHWYSFENASMDFDSGMITRDGMVALPPE